MTLSKRAFDILLALAVGLVLLPVLIVLLAALYIGQGRPLFHVSERMKAPGQPFQLWKLRTMHVVAADRGVSGGDKNDRITPLGRWLRRKRLDEIPQLWNILRGDMSFVGPRPPLREYVDRFPAIYAQVLEARPGVTGLATLVFHRHEEWLLARCASPEETDAVYARACVPRKARLDRIYAEKQSLCFDVRLLWRTAASLFKPR